MICFTQIALSDEGRRPRSKACCSDIRHYHRAENAAGGAPLSKRALTKRELAGPLGFLKYT